jgi:hypothetical protein
MEKTIILAEKIDKYEKYLKSVYVENYDRKLNFFKNILIDFQKKNKEKSIIDCAEYLMERTENMKNTSDIEKTYYKSFIAIACFYYEIEISKE